MGKPGKVMEFLHCYFHAWKIPGGKKSQVLEKVMDIFYIHMCIYVEF